MRRSLSLPAVSIQFPEALEGWKDEGLQFRWPDEKATWDEQCSISLDGKSIGSWLGSFSGILLVANCLIPKVGSTILYSPIYTGKNQGFLSLLNAQLEMNKSSFCSRFVEINVATYKKRWMALRCGIFSNHRLTLHMTCLIASNFGLPKELCGHSCWVFDFKSSY